MDSGFVVWASDAEVGLRFDTVTGLVVECASDAAAALADPGSVNPAIGYPGRDLGSARRR
jgi:hypothetical protein